MIDIIAINGNAVRCFAQVNPVRFYVNGTISFLQENDVGRDLCTGIGGESVAGQADGPQQFRTLGQVFAHFRGFGVHGILGSDKGHDAAGPYLIQRFCEEIVVYIKTELVVSPVIDFVIAEGHVAHSEVKEVSSVGGFKPGHGDIRLGVQLLRDSAGDTVQLHAVQPAAPHFIREHPEEIAHAHGGFQDIARLKAHISKGFIDTADHRRRGIVRVQGGSAGGGVFLRCQGRFQFFVFAAPVRLAWVKGIGQAAPAHILGQRLLFFRGGGSILRFQQFQNINGGHVVAELGFRAAFAQVIVRDVEILWRGLGRHADWLRRVLLMLIYLAASSQVNDKFPHGRDTIMFRDEAFAVTDWVRSFLLLRWLALRGFFLLFRGAGFHRLLLRNCCGFITNEKRKIRFFFQIGAHGIQGHLPKQRIIGFPQHGHVLKAGSAELEIHAVHPKLSAVDMQRSVQGNVIFSEKVFCFFMGAIRFFPG